MIISQALVANITRGTRGTHLLTILPSPAWALLHSQSPISELEVLLEAGFKFQPRQSVKVLSEETKCQGNAHLYSVLLSLNFTKDKSHVILLHQTNSDPGLYILCLITELEIRL